MLMILEPVLTLSEVSTFHITHHNNVRWSQIWVDLVLPSLSNYNRYLLVDFFWEFNGTYS